MRVLAIIPARGGSKGVPRKNIKQLGDKPLIAWTIEVANNSSLLTDVIVSTDDDEIASVAKEHGAFVPFIRPSDLATDLAGAIPVLQHALFFMESEKGVQYDAVIMLQPTTPLRTEKDIDDSITMLKGSDADSVISVVGVGGHHPARMKFIEDGCLIDPDFCEEYENQPRQELPPMYIRNGAIYLTRRESLIAGKLKGEKSLPHLMSDDCSINIDSILDFAIAELLVDQLLNG